MRETLNEMRLIFWEELRRFTHSKGYIILTLIVPTILVVVMGVILIVRGVSSGAEEVPRPIAIVALSSDLKFSPNNIPGALAFNDRQRATDALAEGTVSEIFVIPEDYLKTARVEWLHPEGGALSSLEPGPSSGSAALIRAYVRSALVGEEMASDTLARAVAGTAFERVRVGDDGVPLTGDSDVKVGTLVVSFVFILLLIFSVMIGGASLGEAVAEEKESRMIEVLLTSVKPLSLMTGKVLAIGMGQLMMITVWVGSVVVMVPRIADFIPNVSEFPIDLGLLVWMLAFFLAGYFVSAAVMVGVGAIVTKVQEANQLAFLVIIPLLVSIYTLGLILSNPEGGLARVLSLIPFTAPSAMMIRLTLGSVSTLESLASLTVIVLTGMVLVWGCARVFRAGLLLYGQRMNLRRLIRALRESG